MYMSFRDGQAITSISLGISRQQVMMNLKKFFGRFNAREPTGEER
jgi:hypothetical protein